MRVTYLSPVGTVGGAERVLLAALRAVPDALPGYAPTVILLADGPLRAAAKALGATVIVAALPSAIADLGDTRLRGNAPRTAFLLQAARATPTLLGYARRLRAAIARTRPQLVVTNGVKAHLLAAWAVPRGLPVAWHVHDFLGERPLAGRLLRRLAGTARGVVAVSNAVAADVATVLPDVPVVTVRNGLDTGHFAPGPGVDLDALAGLPPFAGVRVGLVATYANWKGHAAFLAALARVPGVRGYVVGGPISTTAGSQVTRAELVRIATNLGLLDRVGFVPFQPDPVGVYRALDVVVHASFRPEPFGLTVAEAMSCGRAVIVSAAGGAAELFTDGHDALGHPPGDLVALTAAIARLAGDAGLRARLGANARATAVVRFGLPRYGRELASAYRAFVG